MELKSMTDFVIEQNKINFIAYDELWNRVLKYANFIKKPLKLEMFVPCDKDGNVLKEPHYYKDFTFNYFDNISGYDLLKCKKYQKAKKKVLFEGFKVTDADNGKKYLWNGDKLFSIFYDNTNPFEPKTIEDLTSISIHTLNLSSNAINELGL